MIHHAIISGLGEVTLFSILPFIIIGFAAQIVDGALGMAFGVISNTLLITLGVPPAVATASVHTVEVFTTGASGLSHIFHKNVDWRMLWRLVIPGVIGSVLGAGLIVSINASAAKPIVMGYLAIMGIYLVWRGLNHKPQEKQAKTVAPLGLVGGFLDAAGGGGWGPVVTGNLLVQGVSPRKVIGTVNTAEFIVTVTAATTFIAALGLQTFTIATTGILIGGLIAAPMGAVLAKRIDTHRLLIMVGILMTITGSYAVYKAFN